jgi:hypothetical protein
MHLRRNTNRAKPSPSLTDLKSCGEVWQDGRQNSQVPDGDPTSRSFELIASFYMW